MVGPIPGTEASRSSFLRQTGEPRTDSSMSPSSLSRSRCRAFRRRRMFFLMWAGAVFSRCRLATNHRHDLAPSGDPISEKPRLRVEQGPDFRGRGIDKMRDDRCVDRARLGSLAKRVGEGAHLRRIDHDDRQAGDRASPAATKVSKPAVASRPMVCGDSGRSRSIRRARSSASRGTAKLSSRPRTRTSNWFFKTSIPTKMASILSRPCASGLRWQPKRLFGSMERRTKTLASRRLGVPGGVRTFVRYRNGYHTRVGRC